MEILPALDVASGRALTHRNTDGREGAAGVDPIRIAREFIDCGARWIHLVDIDAAFGRGNNAEVLGDLIAQVQRWSAQNPCHIEWSGGVRCGEDIESALSAGADRVNLASQALADLDEVASLIAHFGERLNICIDVEEGRIRPRACEGDVGDVWSVCDRLERAGARRYIVTEKKRDGALMGPPVELLRDLRARTRADLVASGGIRHLDDIRTLTREGYVEGAIVGKALYVGSLNLAQALEISQSVC